MAAGTQTLKDTAKSWGEGVATRWGNANNLSKGFLNPTAIGAGTGMAAGGAYGGLSDNGSVLGGMAGGAMLGAGLGAGGYAGFNKYKHADTWNSLMNNRDYQDIANKKVSRFTNPAFHSPLMTG